jgi:glucose/arabinose dehydrogenase
MLFSTGFPGYTRGVAAAGPDEYIVTTANGDVARFWPAKQESEVIARGFDRLYGVAVVPGGAVVFAEAGTGRVLSVQSGNVEVLATGLREPMGVAIAPDGSCLVSEEGAGRVVKAARGGVETMLPDLQNPQGIVVRGDLLFVVDAGAKELIEYHMASGVRRTIAAGLPVGAPPGVTPKFLRGVPPLSGPMGPFAGIATGTDGTLYLSADAEGSVLMLHQALPRSSGSE